jgi:hypothetical protein
MEEIAGGKSRVWHSNRTDNVEPGEEKRPAAAARASSTQASPTSAYQRLMARRTR